MGIEPGELLASGRAADVFDQGDGTVLRRYRDQNSTEDSTGESTELSTEREAKLMVWLQDRGYPVPIVRHAERGDLVMDLIPGPTMIEDLERRPWRLVAHMKTLARLQNELNELTAPGWLDGDDRIPVGQSLLHLDLHPMNVLISPGGPVVIDWTNARRGDRDFDAALSYILMAGYEAQGRKEIVAQRLLVGLFRRYRGVDAIERCLVDAAKFRLEDRNVTPAERIAVERILERLP